MFALRSELPGGNLCMDLVACICKDMVQLVFSNRQETVWNVECDVGVLA